MQALFNNPLAIMMVIIMVILLLVIGVLANVLLGAAGHYAEKVRKQEEEKKKSPAATATVLTLTGLLFCSLPAWAQDKAATSAAAAGGLSKSVLYVMTGVIFLEVIVIVVMLINLKILLVKEKIKVAAVSVPAPARKMFTWWNKLNKFKPVHEEVDLDLGHNYDGIRELDNRLPPWWLYGFYITIIFAGVYLWRYHVSHTAPSSQEEYQVAMAKAEEQKAAYLKKTAANVDESTVKLLTQQADLEAGKKVFESACAACHGKAGEGMVGPNLTDEFWLHGGSVKDIFKTIKYGVPEKGMKSWKEDFSPNQLAQLSSYIHSLKGTNPLNAKEKQGDLYREAAAAKDSLSNKVVAVQ